MDTIIFIDPLTGEWKCESIISKYTLKGDIVSLATSSVSINMDDKVSVGDIWYIPFDYRLSGVVASIDTNIDTGVQDLTLYVGGDVYPNDVLMVDNTLEPHLVEDNNMYYSVYVNGSVSVTATDNLLGLDTLTRQLMRAQPCTRLMSQDGVYIEYDENPEVIEFRLDDPIISVQNIFFADDQFNTLKLYNQDDLTELATYYMHSDGSVDTNLDTTRVQLLRTMKVGVDEWNSLSYASSVLKSQNYNNEIEFIIPIKNDIGIDHDKYLLGRKVLVHIDGYTPLESIISGYVIEDGYNMKITLGLARSRMTDYLNKEV